MPCLAARDLSRASSRLPRGEQPMTVPADVHFRKSDPERRDPGRATHPHLRAPRRQRQPVVHPHPHLARRDRLVDERLLLDHVDELLPRLQVAAGVDVVQLVIQQRVERGDVLFHHRLEPLTLRQAHFTLGCETRYRAASRMGARTRENQQEDPRCRAHERGSCRHYLPPSFARAALINSVAALPPPPASRAALTPRSASALEYPSETSARNASSAAALAGAAEVPVVSPRPSSLSARSRIRRSAFLRPTRGTLCNVGMSFSRIARMSRAAESADSIPIAREGPTPFAVSSFSNNRFSNTLTNPNSCQESSFTTREVCSATISPTRGSVSYTPNGIFSS